MPLAVAEGGRGHTGGDQFGIDSSEYAAFSAWATAAGKIDFAGTDTGRQFFETRVQPVLLTRGCSFQACHSPQAGNDLKLRSGSVGFFSAVALEKNYELLKDEFMAMEFPDARRARAVAKTILEDDARVADLSMGGIAHRGGPVLESRGDALAQSAQPAACPPVYSPATATPFCTVQEWVRIERANRASEVTNMDAGQTRACGVRRADVRAGRRSPRVRHVPGRLGPDGRDHHVHRHPGARPDCQRDRDLADRRLRGPGPRAGPERGHPGA